VLASVQSAAFLVAFSLVTWVFGIRLGGLDARSLRWRGSPRWFLGGLALGAGPAAAAMALAVPAAGAGWQLDGGTVAAWLATLPPLLAVLAPAALAEELIFRGAPMVHLAAAFGRPAAIVGLAALFGLLHARNPGATPLALGNVALAGVFLGAAFYLPGGLMTAFGAHLGWNLTLAALAAPVSGLPFAVPWLDYRTGQPGWLSGGSFGPEGGLLATLALAVATVVAVRLATRDKEQA
jgi:hypothetical protein